MASDLRVVLVTQLRSEEKTADKDETTTLFVKREMESHSMKVKVVNAESLSDHELDATNAVVVCEMMDAEVIESVRLRVLKAGLLFVFAADCGDNVHVFVDGSRQSKRTEQMMEVSKDSGNIKHIAMMACLKSGGDYDSYLSHFTDVQRVQKAGKIKLYWDIKNIHIPRLREWIASRLIATIDRLKSKHCGYQWTHFRLADTAGSDKDSFSEPPRRVLLPSDDDTLWWKESGWCLRSTRTLMINSEQPSDKDIDLMKDPVLKVDVIPGSQKVKEYGESFSDYKVTLKSGREINIEMGDDDVSTFDSMCVKPFVFDPNSLMQCVVDSTGMVPDSDTRSSVRSDCVNDSEPVNKTDTLFGIIDTLIKNMDNRDFIIPLVNKYFDDIKSSEAYCHWLEWITENSDIWTSESEKNEFFNACLQRLGEFPTKNGDDVMKLSLEAGNAEWVRSCIAFRKQQQSQSSIEEKRADEAIRWSAQNERFAQEYLVKRMGKRGEDCLKTLMEGMVDFIKDAGDFGSLDVFGVVWHSSEERRRVLLERLMLKMKGILDYDTVHKDKVGWHWIRDRVLTHPLWLVTDDFTRQSTDMKEEDSEEPKRDPILFDLLIQMVNDQVSVRGASEIEEGFRAMVKGSEAAWSEVCAYKPRSESKQIRQDLIPFGPVPDQDEDGLNTISLSTGVEFNAVKEYDVKVFMLRSLINSHLLHPVFSVLMKKAFRNVKIGPVKAASRIEPKSEVYAQSGRKWPYTACVMDLIRCSITVKTVPEFLAALRSFEALCDDEDALTIVRCKNGFAKFKDSDKLPKKYCDVKFNVAITGIAPHNGRKIAIIGEVQVLFDTILRAKLKAHELYEITRSLPLMNGAKLRMVRDLGFKSRFALTGGAQKHLASLLVEFPHLFTLSNINMEMIVKNSSKYNSLFLNDLSRAILSISNIGRHKSIVRSLANAINKLESPDYYNVWKWKNPWPGCVKLCYKFCKDSDLKALEFWNMILSGMDASENESLLSKSCAIVFSLSKEIRSQLRYHKCINTEDWLFLMDGIKQGYIPKMKLSEFLDFFACFDETIDKRNLKYLANAIYVMITELNVGSSSSSDNLFPESDDECLRLFDQYKSRFDNHPNFLWDLKEWTYCISPKKIKLLMRMIGDDKTKWFETILRDEEDMGLMGPWVKSATLLNNNKNNDEEDGWSYEDYIRTFGDELPNAIKMNENASDEIWKVFAMHDQQNCHGSRTFNGKSPLKGSFDYKKDLLRLVPDFDDDADGSKEEEYWCKDGYYDSFVRCMVMPLHLFELLITDEDKEMIEGFADDFKQCRIDYLDLIDCFGRCNSIKTEMYLSMVPFWKNPLIQSLDANLRGNYTVDIMVGKEEEEKSSEVYLRVMQPLKDEELMKLLNAFVSEKEEDDSDHKQKCIDNYTAVMKEGDFEEELQSRIIKLWNQ